MEAHKQFTNLPTLAVRPRILHNDDREGRYAPKFRTDSDEQQRRAAHKARIEAEKQRREQVPVRESGNLSGTGYSTNPIPGGGGIKRSGGGYSGDGRPAQ